MSEESGEKTEEPTPKKLEDAREQGQAVRSQDVGVAAGLLALTLCLLGAGYLAGDHLLQLFDHFRERAWLVHTDEEVLALVQDMVWQGLWISVPFIIVSVTMGF